MKWTSAKAWTRGSDGEVYAQLEHALTKAEKQNGFEILGLESGASQKRLRVAFLNATKTFHPNRFARRDPKIRELANRLFVCIKKGYEQALEESEGKSAKPDAQEGATPSAQTPPSRTKSSQTPKSTGTKSVKPKGVVARAKQAMRKAATRHPSPSSMISEMSGRHSDREKQFEIAVSKVMRGNYSEAREEFHQLAASCPSEKKYRVYMHYARGREYAAIKDIDRAKAEYQRAIGLDTEFRLAHSALKEIGSEAAGQRGLFGKLFGK